MNFEIGKKYDVSSMRFTGWTTGDGTSTEGYNAHDYFADGTYLGPDEHGIEPTAEIHIPQPPLLAGHGVCALCDGRTIQSKCVDPRCISRQEEWVVLEARGADREVWVADTLIGAAGDWPPFELAHRNGYEYTDRVAGSDDDGDYAWYVVPQAG